MWQNPEPERQARAAGNQLFTVGNKHAATRGTSLQINGDVEGRYYGYFENEYREQAVFVYEYQTGIGTLWMGDAGWEEAINIVDGKASEIVLSESESLWLEACWKAATRSGCSTK